MLVYSYEVRTGFGDPGIRRLSGWVGLGWMGVFACFWARGRDTRGGFGRVCDGMGAACLGYVCERDIREAGLTLIFTFVELVYYYKGRKLQSKLPCL